MALYEVLAAKREEIIARWKEKVHGTLAPATLPALEIVDHIPDFLNEIIDSLRADVGLPSEIVSSATAAGHGVQRLRLGFSLETVVREYGELRNAILATARDAGMRLSFREIQVISDTTIAGIAIAVSEYQRQRDAELSRQANDHFAFVAHELRNPLSSAMMAFKLLKKNGQIPAGNRTVGALERGLHRANELIEQTLQTARIASGIELHRDSTTLSALFEDAELEARSEAESRGVELRSTIENDQRISLDTRLIRSALSNVVRNGVKYTPAGGIVELRGRITNGQVVIEVEDRCGGLEPGEIEQAFAPFVRLDDRQTGYGLGLAIAKQAIDAHGGNIRVQNVPGKSCIFVLTIPALGDNAEQPEQRQSLTA